MSTNFNGQKQEIETDQDGEAAPPVDTETADERSGVASQADDEAAQQAARRATEARYRAALAAPPPRVDPLQQISIACRTSGKAFYLPYHRAVETAYRAENGKIPGSNRTSRLRKKRRDALHRWSGRRIND